MDLSTRYLGLELKNPVVASSSPLSRDLDGIRRLEDAGAGAVVTASIFEEQISLESQQLDHYLNFGAESFAEAMSYFPEMESYNVGADDYLDFVRKAKESVSIPVIGSLNGVSKGGWVEYAKHMEQAGVDALELNVYYVAADPDQTGAEVEEAYLDIVKEVRKSIRIPLSVKIGPFFSSVPNMARRLSEAGADGLTLFNRFYQPDLDLENLVVVPHLVLSTSNELRLPLRWIAILYGRIPTDFAITSGVHTYLDVLKSIMAGASVTMQASELLMYGLDRINEILRDLEQWMETNEYESIATMRGSMSQQHVKEPAAFERANYMKVLASFRQDPTGRLI